MELGNRIAAVHAAAIGFALRMAATGVSVRAADASFVLNLIAIGAAVPFAGISSAVHMTAVGAAAPAVTGRLDVRIIAGAGIGARVAADSSGLEV